MNLSYRKEQINEKTIVFHLSGKILTKEDSEKINLEIEETIDNNCLQVVLSLSELDFMNSIGLNFIITSFTKLRNAGGELVICEVSKKVNALIVITKLDTIFGVYNALDEAVNSFELNNN